MVRSHARAPDSYATLPEGNQRRSVWAVHEKSPAEPPRPRLLDRVREALRARHMSHRTEESYVAWMRRYIFFHGKRHPAEMGAPEVTRFLTSLAVDGRVAASTQNQALSAMLFLYREVLGVDLPWLDGLVRARRPQRLPVVLTRDEVRAVLQRVEGTPRLMAYLLYGAGLRLLECCRLRVQDVDFASNQIVVRGGKGDKDRLTMLPVVVKPDLARHLELVHGQHRRDLHQGAGWVALPTALARKYPNAGREWTWQGLSRDPDLRRSRQRPAAPAPPPRIGPPTRREGRGASRRDRQTRQPAHVPPLVRDAPAGGRPRYSHRPAAPRAP